MSLKKTDELTQILKLPEWQSDYIKKQKISFETNDNLNTMIRPDRIKENTIKSLTSWIDLGILESIHLKTFESNSKWITKQIKVPEKIVELSIER